MYEPYDLNENTSRNAYNFTKYFSFLKIIIMAPDVSKMSDECQESVIYMIWTMRLELILSTKQITHSEITMV